MLNRIATVRHDGTVEFEVPDNVSEGTLVFRQDHAGAEHAEEEYSGALESQHIPPLQIVMLIVGTRGDVQPFIAIGKRLQVHSIYYIMYLYSFN